MLPDVFCSLQESFSDVRNYYQNDREEDHFSAEWREV